MPKQPRFVILYI